MGCNSGEVVIPWQWHINWNIMKCQHSFSTNM
jgi:hypothetical protein